MTLTPVVDIRSGKKRKQAGTRRELQELHRWQEDGYVAFRTPASMGCCDVIAMRFRRRQVPVLKRGGGSYMRDDAIGGSELVFIEVKANLGNPFMNFRPADRQALKVAARLAGATPLLVHWPPNGERRVIPESEWPPDGEVAAA